MWLHRLSPSPASSWLPPSCQQARTSRPTCGGSVRVAASSSALVRIGRSRVVPKVSVALVAYLYRPSGYVVPPSTSCCFRDDLQIVQIDVVAAGLPPTIERMYAHLVTTVAVQQCQTKQSRQAG